MKELTWVEISRKALSNNMSQFRNIIGRNVLLCPCIKANAYGHDLIKCGKIFLKSGADWLSVNAIYEARALRQAGIEAPIYVLGYIPLDGLEEVFELNVRTVVYNYETVDRLEEIGKKRGEKAKVHLKIETGNNRQGLNGENLYKFAKYIKALQYLEIEGAATHFANIEDTTDHSYAERQLENFEKELAKLEEMGIEIQIRHCANSAATILFRKTHFDMVRSGLSSFGMWPSKETYVSYKKEIGGDFDLIPAFTWKAKIAQVKQIPADSYIGYGCSYQTTRETRLAILPVGYYDGYDRGVNGAYVLIRGKRAPLRGRVCMNIIMADVSDIPGVKAEDTAVLIGRDGDEEISAEKFADWAGTINYEIPTRVNERIPRILV